MRTCVLRPTTICSRRTSKRFQDSSRGRSPCWRKRDWLAQLDSVRLWPENLNKSSMSSLRKTPNFLSKNKTTWKRSKSWTHRERRLSPRARLSSQPSRVLQRTRARPRETEQISSESCRQPSASKKIDSARSCAKSKAQSVSALLLCTWTNSCAREERKRSGLCKPKAVWMTSRHH